MEEAALKGRDELEYSVVDENSTVATKENEAFAEDHSF
jgi:hypothetical protein